MGGIVSRPSPPPAPAPAPVAAAPEPVAKAAEATTGPQTSPSSSPEQQNAGRRRAVRGGRALLAGSPLGVGSQPGAIATQNTLGPRRR